MRARTILAAAALGASALAALLALTPDDPRGDARLDDVRSQQPRAAAPAPLFPPTPRGSHRRSSLRRGPHPATQPAVPAAPLPGLADSGGLPPMAPPAQLPATAAELRAELVRLSAATTAAGVSQYAATVDALRTDRELAAELLRDGLAELPRDEQRGADGRPLIQALGEVAHPRSLPVLAELATRPLPPLGAEDPDHLIDPHRDGAIGAAMALRAMVKVVDRTHDPVDVRTVEDTLQAVLADPDADVHVAVTASLLLRAHADNPTAEQLRQEQLLGPDRAWVALVEARTALPPLAD